MLRHAPVGQLLPDHAEGLHRLVAHHGLLDLRQVLERRQQLVRVRRAPHIGHELAQLLGHGKQHLILVVVGLGQEGEQLVAGALLSERERDRAQALD